MRRMSRAVCSSATGLPTGWEANPGLSTSSLNHPASLTAGVPLTISAAAWANPASQQILRARSESLTLDYAPMFLPSRGDGLVDAPIKVVQGASTATAMLAVLAALEAEIATAAPASSLALC